MPANYDWVPVAYHSRASSVQVSSRPVPRPNGQFRNDPAAQAPQFGPSCKLDYELELGFYVGTGNEQGSPIFIEDAECHVFGVSLLNDWSARDFQRWEAQPLGPFMAKNFATSVSPWVVTWAALQPYRTAFTRDQKPQIAYLNSDANAASGGIDIALQCWLETAAMRRLGQAPVLLCNTSSRYAHWTVAQMITHHTSGGCNLVEGDLLGSGTMSGPGAAQAACLFESTAGGATPLVLPSGETRTYLEDGDRVIIKGSCNSPGRPLIGFGSCDVTIAPAMPYQRPASAAARPSPEHLSS